MEKRLETYCETMKQIIQSNQFPKTINSALSQITATIEIDKVDVSDRVRISKVSNPHFKWGFSFNPSGV